MKIAIDSKLPRDARAVLRYAISTLSKIVPCDGTSIMLKEGDDLVIRVYALLDPSADVESKLGFSLKIGDRIAGKAAEKCETMVVEGDASKDKRFAGMKKFQEILYGLSTPIMKGDSCVGVINVKRSTIDKELSDVEVEIVEKFAKNLGEVL